MNKGILLFAVISLLALNRIADYLYEPDCVQSYYEQLLPVSV